ncbi:MAG TPA: PhnD/SsuA/transferrin family substrate-binding protein [Nitrospirota bacterium]|nr:PhnD/SsuA/transferrin family substrate-binding protein [Nitrospirota bacterium]
MKRIVIGFLILFGVVIAYSRPSLSTAEQFRIAIMQDQPGAAEKFTPVLEYLSKKGINAIFAVAQDYPAAAGMFAVGSVDAMFSGSGVAGFMILKDLATPAVRPVDKSGHSTYWAAVIAKKGSPKFTGSAKYFSGKRVIFTSLASSGDFYFHSLPGAENVNATEINVASHGAALEAVNKGLADVAIVKNRVWDALKNNYPDLTMVGEDKGENPDGTLIISTNVPSVLAAKVSDALLEVKDDPSAEAAAVRKTLGIQGFIRTTPKDFEHTLSLLKKADVTKRFNVAL